MIIGESHILFAVTRALQVDKIIEKNLEFQTFFLWKQSNFIPNSKPFFDRFGCLLFTNNDWKRYGVISKERFGVSNKIASFSQDKILEFQTFFRDFYPPGEAFFISSHQEKVDNLLIASFSTYFILRPFPRKTTRP